MLLLWAVCYGRCLAEQYGGSASLEKSRCEHQCCQKEKKEVPPPTSGSPCEVCEFIKSGVVLPSDALVLDVPFFCVLENWKSAWLYKRDFQLVDDEAKVEVTDPDPPPVARMCEWMASTAAPVRGPNALG